ncbi:beta-lactamase family protein [Kribbella sandramycini]|uniref:Beta-lactamase family protein n=1 Tax=Kribbella sandramycini TaxID=60450 RepID=A0A7Y4L085_9ACTN|nr:serine hydrolase domain-containing protein [Kribbella sandramycini]MBB6565675.1 D-alanyl-D-alanine carboxypeptidase [Kribbella sandramycini]NOL41938.1 beta-lactamase family protein [Kribbella sandramycini]
MFRRLATTAIATACLVTPLTAVAVRSDPMQQRVDELAEAFPGAIATVRDTRGKSRTYVAGVANLTTRARVDPRSRVRIGSNTKPFTATVVLQLVGEGKLALEDPIEKYLPGLVRGDGIDGRRITVRQLLQHTSGIPEYHDLTPDYPPTRHTYWEPRDLVDIALQKKALFPPGEGYTYSNTNYILAGLLVQKVTGRPLGEEITRRVIEPAGLRDTYWPALGDQQIHGPHPTGYFQGADITELDPSIAWAAGGMVGTPADMNRFLVALLQGKLLKPAQLEQMLKTVDSTGRDSAGKSGYGLGIAAVPLSCGGVAWGHGGQIYGYETLDAATPDGRAAALAVTSTHTTSAEARRISRTVDTAFCGADGGQ